jgi:hypothetical protein
MDDGLAVVLGQASPHAVRLAGGESVERAGYLDGTTRTDCLGRRFPSTPGGCPLAIRREEQRGPEVPARGVLLQGPGPRPAIPDRLRALWWAMPAAGWGSSLCTAHTAGRPGHANLPTPTPALRQRGLREHIYISCIDSCIVNCQDHRLRAWTLLAASHPVLGRQPAVYPARSAPDRAERHPALPRALPGPR